jgi:hypothetical protein
MISTLKTAFLNNPPVPYPLVRLGMTESFRVARRGGEAEFRAVLGLPVIPNAPGAQFRMNKVCGHAETLIQR